MPLKLKSAQVIDHFSTGASYRAVRCGAGKSLKAIAKRMGVSASYLSDLERGRRNWDAGLAERADKAFASARRAPP